MIICDIKKLHVYIDILNKVHERYLYETEICDYNREVT